MAGYLWQVAEACRRSLSLSPDQIISIEQHDDIAVANFDGSEIVCEQLKHSQAAGTFSEGSPIWWQSIRVWATNNDPKITKRLLVTTDTIQPGCTLSKCYRPISIIPWAELEAFMDETAANAPNDGLTSAYQAWLGMKPAEKRKLLESIELVDKTPNLNHSIEVLDAEIGNLGIDEKYVEEVRESYLGAFSSKVFSNLDSGGVHIAMLDLKSAFMDAVARTLQPGYYDFPELPIDKQEVLKLKAEKNAHMIPQLDWIGFSDPAKVLGALETWFRARTHRDRIMNSSVQGTQDVKRHDKNLVAFWSNAHDGHSPCDDPEAKEVGWKVHHVCMGTAQPVGRTPADLQFSQGSYYELSNDVTVRWHPKYPKPGGKP